ncbi:retrovirus-related Pol polyprotein from transposon 17.6 [Nephila pilipes]|uniref:Retrovirus-related Pol polyprotein from transposon 17.6 n=1 Tax=Nephila pilipes TaxID=299642 RepID=A0A8X6QQH7_NEPPI|nr:retrovirus-related Pol polyprotein from transposon 17.6 [Nephila pilipes]
MFERSIISKAEEPTDWVSNVVVIDSPKKLRICLDPRPLNEAIQRPYYPIPITDVIMTQLQGVEASRNGIPVDASRNRTGAVFLQQGQLVVYGSVSLTEMQQRYAQTEKELMSVKYGLEYFNYYTYGRKVTVPTDHRKVRVLSKKSYEFISCRLQHMLH